MTMKTGRITSQRILRSIATLEAPAVLAYHVVLMLHKNGIKRIL
jgi:hypothetical protein